MTKWFKFGLAAMVAMLVVSCGTPDTLIFRTLGLAPRSFVERSRGKSSILAVFAFDVPKMREQLGITHQNPKGAESGLGIVTAKPFPVGQLPESLDSMKMQGFLSCPTYSMQAVTNTTGLNQFLRGKGFAEKKDGNVMILASKPDSKEYMELPQFCAIGDKGAIQIDRGDMELGISASDVLSGGEDSVLSYPFVSDVAKSLQDYPAIAFIFPLESYLMRINGGGITSGLFDPGKQADMIEQFKVWGRPRELEMVGIGSRIVNDAEQVRFCFQYQTEQAAQEDMQTLKTAIRSTPSLITGKVWFKNLNLTDPLISIEGRQVFLNCDFEARKEKGPFTFHKMFAMTANLYDWGILWKR